MDYVKYVINLQVGIDKSFITMNIVIIINQKRVLVSIIIEKKLFKQLKKNLIENLILVLGKLEIKT